MIKDIFARVRREVCHSGRAILLTTLATAAAFVFMPGSAGAWDHAAEHGSTAFANAYTSVSASSGSPAAVSSTSIQSSTSSERSFYSRSVSVAPAVEGVAFIGAVGYGGYWSVYVPPAECCGGVSISAGSWPEIVIRTEPAVALPPPPPPPPQKKIVKRGPRRPSCCEEVKKLLLEEKKAKTSQPAPAP